MLWQGIRKNFGSFLLLLLLIVIGSLAPIGMLSDSNFTLHHKTEKEITSKYSTNGSYFGPSHYFVSDDGIPNRVSKHKMYNLQIRDKYKAWGSSTIYDLILIGIAVLIFVPLFIWIIWILTLKVFGEIKWIKSLESYINNFTKNLEYFGKITGKTFAIAFMIISIICLSLIGKNIFHKVVPFNKSMTQAEIVDRNNEVRITPQLIILNTYTLTLQYTNDTGNVYKTEKDVSHLTYDNYKHNIHIPIAYRDNRPYDVFIVEQSFKELISSILRIEIGIIGVVVYLNYFLIRKYIVSKKKLSE